MKRLFLILIAFFFVICAKSQIDTIYKNALSKSLIGTWNWVGSNAGLSGMGFGGPNENGYKIRIVIYLNKNSNNLEYSTFKNDTLKKQGIFNIIGFNSSTKIWQIKSILTNEQSEIINPFDTTFKNDMIIYNNDSILFYNNSCSDCYGYIYKKVTPLTVNAGKDTSYCRFYGSIILGGTPTAIGGLAPYKYKWKIYFLQLDSIIDTTETIANPVFSRLSNGTYVMKVTVSDALNNSVTDSVIISNSTFALKLCCGVVQSVNGDSVELSTHFIGGIGPRKYIWSPMTGLSNPYIEKPKAKPTFPNITYYVKVTDSLGCYATDWGMTVTNIKNGDLYTGFVSHKNPILNSGTMNFTSELLGSILQIVSVGGIIQYQSKIESESIPLGSLIPTSGIYFYTLTNSQNQIIRGSFIKE